MSDQCGPTVAAVLKDLVRRPGRHLVARWNWKAALLSGILRGALFFAASLRAGLDAAVAALAVEFAYRAATTAGSPPACTGLRPGSGSSPVSPSGAGCCRALAPHNSRARLFAHACVLLARSTISS